jgi:hypothetical protein
MSRGATEGAGGLVERHTRNHAVAGGAILVGAALIGFGASQEWVTGAVHIAWGPLAGSTPNGGLRFDVLVAPNGSYGDVTPLIIGAALVLALAAILLIATRVPGLGMLWRLLALPAVVGLVAICASAWSVANDPASVIVDGESPAADRPAATGGPDIWLTSAQAASARQVEPGPGLWLLTAGCGVAGIGALTPATRRTASVPEPGGPRRQ